MEVGNEMEIFITRTKYNTCQRHEEGNQLLVVNYLVSILPPYNSVQHIYEDWDTPINVHMYDI